MNHNDMSVLISDAEYNMMESVLFNPPCQSCQSTHGDHHKKKTPTSHAFTSEYDHAKRNCCNDYACAMLNNILYIYIYSDI